jgi:hypothetical protein
MKKLRFNILLGAAVGCALMCGSCSSSDNDSLTHEANIMISFKVTGQSGKVFNSSIGEDTIKIKMAPQYDATTELKDVTPVFYLSDGATVSPDPSVKQDFSQAGGVKYTVTSSDGEVKHQYIVTYGLSDILPSGQGFSYAEQTAKKSFTDLGYPGEVWNFGLEPEQYGDLQMYHGYCGDYIVLVSLAYIQKDPTSKYCIRVFDKTTLEESGSLNVGSINISNIKMVTSDYEGHFVAAVASGNSTEFFYWKKPTDAPTSVGTIGVNMAPASDTSNNFQVAGDITSSAWITALAPRDGQGTHYRIQVTGGKLASNYTTVVTGYASDDCSGFQMISPMDSSDKPQYVIGDTEGSAGAAWSVHCYVNSNAGSTLYTMPAFWQNILQAFWVGTGCSTARIGGRTPVVSALPINGKSYIVLTSGTAWYNLAAVVSSDLQNLADPVFNVANVMARAWSYGSWVDWYWSEDKKEAYLAIWFDREGLTTFKMTCYE